MEEENKEQQSFSERMQQSQIEASEGEVTAPPLEQKKEHKGWSVNKYVVIVGVLVLIVVAGALYRTFFVAEIDKPVVTGEERFLSIVTHENTWRFEPEVIEAEQGDKITLTITNEDEYDHGFAIDAFGISQRMPAKSTIVIDFVVTKAGEFPFYCSVSCGSGVVNGEERGHFDQIGRLHVRSLISETVDYAPEPTANFAAEARKAAMLKEADRKIEELGFHPEDLNVTFDEGNREWTQYSSLITSEALEVLENVDFQAVYYSTDVATYSIWILINTKTGEVIMVRQ
jgi:plastocyanin